MGRHRDDSLHRAYEVEQLWDVHHEIMRLSLIGLKRKDIAAQLGITEQMVGYTLRSSIVERQMDNMRASRDVQAVDISVEIKNLAPKAVEVLEDLLDCELPNIRLKAAADVLDRAGYAAVRTIRTDNVHVHFTPSEIEEIKKNAKEVGLVIDIEANEPLQLMESAGGAR